ncbi:MAG: dihydroorotase [Halothiobacillus sp. 24-54-40]|jgi:dihydroorotase|nr:dihydroorotase [Halothiobacillaceae bacterium]OYV47125.1 MAG: dihydroorotase [Halothiobacillus sp. 20-53-49]OYY40818.1 MAG: dihydroorotase [Halothiobacillus sp. 35-54-62]OYY55814.1 MAG: dihydroorotase [Halothiobacillus sp. 28-55-5]OYZ86298.1 MAG: dihydroorotase [Halothiobacillus sp. 24-54-40]OZA80134.1 MAG: dihydroorotase [Halothiobacillus sp. 39-53-45]HQS03406.1 dihydroorotase [Halothiobacillus sp.]
MIQNPPNLGIDLDPVRHPEGCRPGIDCDTWIIHGARVLDPSHNLDITTDVYLADGRIVGLGTEPAHFNKAQAEHVHAQGQWLIAGIIDTWARLREPGLEHKATIATETLAAVSGGITTLCMPPDTDPVLDSIAVARFIKRRAQLAGRARVAAIGALTQGLKGELLAEMAELTEGGCVAISNAHYPVRDLRLLRRALEYAATFDILVVIQPQDPSLAKRGCAHEGVIATRLGLPGIPVSAETAPLAQLLAIMAETGARVHINNLSSRAGVRLIEQAKADGLPITASVSAHHLWLSEMDTDALCGNTHVQPPLRSLRDRDALRQGLAAGTIDCVISDHQPHEMDAKLAPFPETEPGISGLETLLPLVLKLVDDGVLTLERALDALTRRPAHLFGFTDSGQIAIGARADLALINPDAYWVLDNTTLLSAGRDTPFFGWDFRHQTTMTWVNGKRVFSRSEPLSAP